MTRPDEAGRALTAQLTARGAPAIWLPAFDLAPAPDSEAARRTLANLARFDLAIFVSPAAVRATAALFGEAWPQATAIGAVGNATRAAVTELLHPAEAVQIIAPAGADDGSGSEALWRALQDADLQPRNVLILRAASGREWLGETLAQHGAQVAALAVYDRCAHELTAAEHAQLTIRAGPALDSVFTSSEAVGAMRDALAPVSGAWSALQRGVAVASHSRIAKRLRAAGFVHVVVAPLEAGEILAAIAASQREQSIE